jgi:hypothetical protein
MCIVVHKLLVEVEIEYNHEEYKKMLRPYELPRGVDIFFTFHVTNLSDTDFNGKLKKISASYGVSGLGSALTSSVDPDSEISLRANEGDTIHQEVFETYTEGLMWMSVEFSANDNSPLEYLQRINSKPVPNWSQPFFIVSREQLETLLVLRKLESKLVKES